jgi:hypothetical protein
MYKIDMLNEIQRFLDVAGGVLVEYIQSCEPDHPDYVKPLAGYKRPVTSIKNVWVACGPDLTVLIQMGKLILPFPASKWVATTIGSLAGKSIVDNLVKNSMKPGQPGNAWEKFIVEDETRLYERLNACVDSDASKLRKPKDGGMNASMSERDLEDLFQANIDRLDVAVRPSSVKSLCATLAEGGMQT